MAVEAGTQQERITGRVWTVRLDPFGRPSAGTVRLSCTRPACAEQRFPSTAAGRRAAVDHVKGHLAGIRSGGGPRGGAWCGCRAADCAWHTPDESAGRGDPARRSAAGAVRCGGPVVLTVYADRAGRLWRIAETCARCAAATPDCRVLDTAPPPSGPDTAPAGPDVAGVPAAAAVPAGAAAPVFSDHSRAPAGTSTPTGAPVLPSARKSSPTGTARPPRRPGKIAQRTVPSGLQPDVLRLELIELGDAFRSYQQRSEPNLALLAELHDRKGRAFALWADLTGDESLRHDAARARAAAKTTREMHRNRSGEPIDSEDGKDGPAIERLLTRNQAVHARTVLDYVPAGAPQRDAAVHVAVLMLTLRAARAGTGNITGQDLTGWLQADAGPVLQQLIDAGWLRLPCTVDQALASGPENPAQVTVPALMPESPQPFDFGKTTRSRISGWAQKALGDRTLRKKKLGAPTRLLALYTAAHAGAHGRLGHARDGGLALDRAAAFCALPPDQVTDHAELLLAADWLAETDTAAGRLRGQLTDRVLPLSGLL